MVALDLLGPLLLTGLLLAASVFDVTTFRIPNPIPLAVIGLFLANAGTGLAVGPLLPHFFVFLLVLGLGFFAFVLGVMGGGDAKLMAALGLWFGPSALPDFIAITGIAGGLFALLLLVLRRPGITMARASKASPSPRPPRLLDPTSPVPYAVPMTLAALWLAWF
jgi:prepilin peptidase CpaA